VNWVQGFLYKRIISAIKRAEFINDRMSYIILRGRWFHIIVPNVHAPTEDKIDDAYFVGRFQPQSRQRRHF
jgi:hypothetical protein